MKSAKKFRKWSKEECAEIHANMLSADTCYADEKILKKNAKVGLINFHADEVKTLHSYQIEAIEKLKQMRIESVGTDEIKSGQFLAFMQGIPGAGKTTTAKRLAQKLGMHPIFSGTTATAAAQLKADTINKVAKLGLNLPDFDGTTLKYETNKK